MARLAGKYGLVVSSVLWVKVACMMQENVPITPEMQESAVDHKPLRLAKSEPFVQCEICHLVAAQIWSQMETAARDMARNHLGEVELEAIAERVCIPEDADGEWVTMLDIVEDNGSLTLQKQEEIGECRRECMTVVHVCRQLFEEHHEEVSERLYKHVRAAYDVNDNPRKKDLLTETRFTSWLCRKLSKKCPGKTPPAGFKHKDEAWMEMHDAEGYRMRKMQYLANIAAKEQGTQPVKMYDPGGINTFMRSQGLIDDEF